MKKIKILMIGLLFTLSIAFTSCKKDEKNDGNNFAATLEGTYIGNVDQDAATTIITRISNNLVNLQISGSSVIDRCLDSVNVNTASTFNFNEYDGCYGEKVTGGGSLSGSTLNYTWRLVGESESDGSITFTGSK